MLSGNVLHQFRYAHPALAEHSDDAVEGIARAAAEEHGLTVFDERYGEKRFLVLFQRCPALLAADARTTCGISSACSGMGSLTVSCTPSLACSCMSADWSLRLGVSILGLLPKKSCNAASMLWLLKSFFILV